MFRLKSHFWPAWRLHPLCVVSGPRIIAFWCPKDTYFTSFSRLRSVFEKSTYFTVLSRLCMACANGANRPEGRFSPTRWSLFRSEMEAEHIFFDPLRSYFHHKIQWFSQFFAEVEDRFGKLVKYVPLGHQRALWGRFSSPKTPLKTCLSWVTTPKNVVFYDALRLERHRFSSFRLENVRVLRAFRGSLRRLRK